MGNSLSAPASATRNVSALDSFVSELGQDIVFEKSLGASRFLKTVRCRHRNGYLVVKIFVKHDAGLSLRNYVRRLKLERESLHDISNVYSHQTFVETDRAGYIVRQWLASSLYDRISTRPFLTLIEKKWIAFQILNALRDARNRKISHGDIKSENVLVTSWNWVYLTDFASYKPTYLPLDDPSDFSLFFDTSGRRTCYVAPERFYAAGSVIDQKKSQLDFDRRDGRVTEAMDVFSAGCVLAELFAEGVPPFTLAQMFQYRAGELSEDAILAPLVDVHVEPAVVNLIRKTIALEPTDRTSFDTLLHTARGNVFPEAFYSFLHNFVAGICESSEQTTQDSPSDGSGFPSDSDHRIERLWAEFESLPEYLIERDDRRPSEVHRTAMNPDALAFQDLIPIELNIPNRDSKLTNLDYRAPAEDGCALIILSLVCSNIRNCVRASAKLKALDVLLALAGHMADESKLDRMIPYVVDLLHDDTAVVRIAAARTTAQILDMVTVITPFNASVFPEYILPNMRHLASDSDVSVRCAYAQCITSLADNAIRYLEMAQALRAERLSRQGSAASADPATQGVSYEARMQELHASLQDTLDIILSDPSSAVKRGVLRHIGALSGTLGRDRTNDTLLSHMITFLNDQDWALRHAFFEGIVDVVACVGKRSLEEYIFPLMIQALSDVEEAVVARVLASLTILCGLGLFEKMRLWELMSATLPFLYHPDSWIRQGAIAFLAAAAKQLPPADVWCILYPSLRHFLRSDVITIDEYSLVTCSKPYLSRTVFDAAIAWAMRADKSPFWTGTRRSASKNESAKESMIASRKSPGHTSKVQKSEDDDVQLVRLRQLGMTATEESKLQALRDYIVRLANANSNFAARTRVKAESEDPLQRGLVELQKIGVVPKTVFTGSRSHDASRTIRASSLRHHLLAESRGSRTPTASTPGGPDGNDAPFEDLRRRLAVINGSTASLQVSNSGRDRRESVSSQQPDPALPSSPTPVNVEASPQPEERPMSPTESVASSRIGMPMMPGLHRLGTETQKAAPTVGPVRTNATGIFEASSRLRMDMGSSRSGRASPAVVANLVRDDSQRASRTPSAPAISTYDGQEPSINHLLEHMFLDNYRDGLADFGPRVNPGPPRRRGPGRQTYTTRDSTSKRLETTLISHLVSHSDVINDIAVSPDHLFFVTCSDDKTVKVWDTARLERNVTSKPRHTYGQHHARVTAVCILEASHCFASAGDDGSLHIVRVHLSQSTSLPKYGKLQVIREHRVVQQCDYITCLRHSLTESASELTYTTTQGSIVTLDLRTMRTLRSMQNPAHFGPVTCFTTDKQRTWMIASTANGILTLWDLRFSLLLRSWQIGTATYSGGSRIHAVTVHPTKGQGKWVVVSADFEDSSPGTLMEVWDIEKEVLVERFDLRESRAAVDASDVKRPLAQATTERSPADAIRAYVEAREKNGGHDPDVTSADDVQSPSSSHDILSLLAGVDFGSHSGAPRVRMTELSDSETGAGFTQVRPGSRGYLITGSEDHRLRMWDLGRVEKSSLLSGWESETERPRYSTTANAAKTMSVFTEYWDSAAAKSLANRPAQRMTMITHHQQNLLKAHQDSITSVARIDSPFRGGIISGDRAGVIKVWRVEGID